MPDHPSTPDPVPEPATGPATGSGSGPVRHTEPVHDRRETSRTSARSGREVLLTALRRRPGRGQTVAGVLLALLGFAAAVQVNAVNSDTPYAGTRRDDLVQLLQTLSAAQDRSSRQLAELRATRDSLVASTDQRAAALEEAQAQLEAVQVLAGTVGVAGPGVVITIDDPTDSVSSLELLNAIQELRDAGAEAIEINDTARVVAQTAVGDGTSLSDGRLTVGSETVTAPYVIEAIGNPDTLSAAVAFRGGLTDDVEVVGGTVTVDTPDEVRITSLAPEAETDFVQPST
ncbi:MAG: hypothetical protein K0Q93_1584 [Nocardioidaceae bacterium]|jgi:uncharacterized protein YlxW (UPF0749 family)|nr:hypothetical protein [Nocardioidaceae bacterium]